MSARENGNMIVDVHTHFFRAGTDFGPKAFEDIERNQGKPSDIGFEFNSEDYLKATEAADVVIVFGLHAEVTGWLVPNDAVYEHVKRAPNRLIFFCSPDPGRPDYMEELERCHQDLGCKGVKLGPIYQGVHPLDKKYYDIYRYCESHHLPILTHMATTFSSSVPLDFARPAHMDKVAIDFPDLKIVMAHLGHPWEGETIAAIRKQPNLFSEISGLYYRPWQFYNSMRLLSEYHAESNVLFGSDFPFTTTSESITGLRNVNAILGTSGLPEIPEDVIEGIIHRDSLNMLGLEDPREKS